LAPYATLFRSRRARARRGRARARAPRPRRRRARVDRASRLAVASYGRHADARGPPPRRRRRARPRARNEQSLRRRKLDIPDVGPRQSDAEPGGVDAEARRASRRGNGLEGSERMKRDRKSIDRRGLLAAVAAAAAAALLPKPAGAAPQATLARRIAGVGAEATEAGDPYLRR